VLEQQNNNENKATEKCQCTKKIIVLEKQIKELKTKLEEKTREIEIVKKALKFRG
jgi:hypothetical protein